MKVKMDYYDTNYINYANVSVTRMKRHGTYYVNFGIDSMYTANNNVSVCFGCDDLWRRPISTNGFFSVEMTKSISGHMRVIQIHQQ